MNNLGANIPTITELLLEKGIVTVRDTLFKKNKSWCFWKKFPVGGERVHSSDRWSGKSLRRDQYGRASMWSYWDRTEQAKGTAEHKDPCKESHGKKANIRK